MSSGIGDLKAKAEALLAAAGQPGGKDIVSALGQARAGVSALAQLLASLEKGDKVAVASQFTEWDDVNRTLSAVQDMERAIQEAKSRPTTAQVLGFVEKGLTVALRVALAVA